MMKWVGWASFQADPTNFPKSATLQPAPSAMSDRIIVMSNGEVAGTLEPHEYSEERILRLAVFGKESQEGMLSVG